MPEYITDKELAEIVCRAMLMIVRALVKKYGIVMRVPDTLSFTHDH